MLQCKATWKCMQNCKMMVLDGLIFFKYMCYSQVDHPQQRPVGSDFLSAGSSGKGAKATESLGAVEVLSASQCLLKFLLHFDCNMRIVSMESMIYIYIYRIEHNTIYIYIHIMTIRTWTFISMGMFCVFQQCMLPVVQIWGRCRR